MSSKGPSRGVLAGIKADAARAKETGETYNPNGTGVAWSHNFLNQKPWHPLSYRNQKRRFEAQEKSFKDAKTNQEAQREFEEEQTRLQSMSFLNEKDRARYSELQSVSFMYAKPPGLDAALQRDKTQAEKESAGGEVAASGSSQKPSAAAAGTSQAPPPAQEQRRLERPVPKIDAASLLAAKEALAAQQRLSLKHAGYRSPTHGGFDEGAENQQMLVGSSSEEEEVEEANLQGGAVAGRIGHHHASGSAEAELDSMFSALSGPEDLERLVANLPDRQRRSVLRSYAEWRVEFEERQRDAARAFLKTAGYKEKKHKKTHKKSSKKKEKKHKKSRHHSHDSDSSDGDEGGQKRHRTH